MATRRPATASSRPTCPYPSKWAARARRALPPEHLFAVGYAACFGSSIDFVAKQRKRDATKTKVSCAVTIGPREGGGFGLAVLMRVEDESLAQADLAAIVREAHERVCPYSHAIRGNVEVTFEVMGG
jgi:Ohr subfamily peroxiredoxin